MADPNDYLFAQSEFPVPQRIVDGVDRARRQIAAPGTWLTGAERVAVAQLARATQQGSGSADRSGLSAVGGDGTVAVAVNAHGITAQTVDGYEAAGLTPETYVEIVGVVARTIAIDTTTRGLGLDPVPLPAPEEGEPTRQRQDRAKRRSAFVPTVGAARATSALSSVLAEDVAQENLHGALYLSYPEMGNISIIKGLPRWQLELIAARTSKINECFY